MRKLTVTTLGLALASILTFAVKAQAAPVTTTSGELPRHAGFLWGKVKTQSDQSAVHATIIVREIVNNELGGPVAVGQTDVHGDYNINISSLPRGKYVVEVQPTGTLSGAYLPGQTFTILRGPQASKHIDWTLSGQQSAMPYARWTKVPATPAPSGE
jgi:hypothetical protein